MPKTLFAFDLDGTITEREILPALGVLAGVGDELARLTARTLSGEIGFEESFRIRFQMLRHIPLKHIEAVIADIPLNAHIERFITTHRGQCVIVTGNLDRWIRPLTDRLGCVCYCSTSKLTNKKGLELLRVLDKGAVIRELAPRASSFKQRIVAVGESANDVPMFRHSSVGIAFGGVHRPVAELMRMADHVSYTGHDLCRLLHQLM